MQLGRHVVAAACAALWLSAAGAVRAETFDQLYNDGVKARLEQRFDDAAKLLNRALALLPENADAILQLGLVHLALNDLVPAQAAFNKVLTLAPDYADAKFGLAQVRFRKGDFDGALALIEPVAKAQPDNKEFAALLANVRKAKLAKQPAARSGDQPHKTRGADIGKLMETARRQRISGQFVQAERTYRKVLAVDPRNTDALTALGLIAGARKDYGQASRFFHAALAIDKKHFDARLGLARLAVWQNDIVTARTRTDLILRDAPRNSEALLLDGQVSLIENDHERAGRAYDRVLAAEPRNVDALIGRGDVLRARRDASGARAAYEAALLLDPTSIIIRDRLAGPFPTMWRIDAASEISDLTTGDIWTDSFVNIGYRPNDKWALGARPRAVTRYGDTDIQLEIRADYSVDPQFIVTGWAAGTPEADILAQYLFGAGAAWQALPKHDRFGPVWLNLEARYDHFSDSDIVQVSPWIQAYFFDERLGVSGRWVHVEDDLGTTVDGYVLRGDLQLSDTVLLFGGYSDAPEIDDGTIVDAETMFTGLSVDVNDAFTLHGNYAYERRQAFDRYIYGFGLTVRF